MRTKEHWEKIYSGKAPDSLSWFQEHADRSLKLIRKTAPSHSSAIIDAGGGASALVHDLSHEGCTNLTVLDLSGSALEAAKAQAGSAAEKIHWIEGDVLTCRLPEKSFDIWHDRAVFHFLSSETDRIAYREKVFGALKPGGYLIMAVFAEDGPEKCSGLPVVRYSPERLSEALGKSFTLLHHEDDFHRTPSGNVQHFIFCTFQLTTLPDYSR
jgi:SAM-dependent methyltransferase